MRSAIHNLLATLTLVLVAGCGRVDDAAPLQALAGFDSAEIVVEQFNQAMLQPPFDIRRLLAITYVENDRHREIMGLVRDLLPIIEFQIAVMERFEIGGMNLQTLLGQAAEPARIVEHSGERALARYSFEWGDTGDVHLVKVGDRWWLSAYTFEYRPQTKEMMEADPMVLEFMTMMCSTAVPPMIDAVRRGDFKTAEQANWSLQRAFLNEVTQHPEKYQRFNTYFSQNPDAWKTFAGGP